MDYKWRVRQVAFAALMLIGGFETGCAQPLPQTAAAPVAASQDDSVAAVQAQPAAAAQPLPGSQSAALTPDEAQQNAAGNVAELQQLIRGSELNELRTTYNGTYGASLLFNGKEMTYYVALFQNKTFWRVIKTSDEQRAEAIYRDFAQKTVQLSDVELRRTRLEAQKAFTARMIALTQDHANRLQADLTVARQQQAIVADQQKQTRDQANALQAEKSQAQDQLRQVQRQVRELQRQVEGGLPVH
ncbi:MULTISPECIES: DUF2968 domain-containing protein [Paraburkholderia]|uniref:DUF2968 domain-containing protein n=1 Tax=Paraburkholderia tropica TaxID=92647 RepID=A0A1A5X652_9BURK|nr:MULTISPECIES: DUF2968 domain-containing protein [Paraburkholderia]MDE1142741.1 DUF2968 domain-containing protein [Paraburkholderia tropica]OBR48635.1 hypothetical protein A6456_28375 [Paraburkholderia tropica]PXX14420.1 hypothetical protein C7400_11227 [Paraburkholderia tropica]PZW79486.1 hypothetical protein C7399_11227 [Paraburkholderia tropica]QNB11639.1 DUF2968 domain-containing protein [Paraburkholderia tropica]